MGYIGSDPVRNDSVSTAQLADDAVTSPKIVDDIVFTNVTASNNVSASGTVQATSFQGIFEGALSSSAQIATSISGSFTAASSSFSTRVTRNEASASSLTTASSSFSTRITAATSSISALKTDSGSFSTRITAATSSISALKTDSGSFSTRVTDNNATGSILAGSGNIQGLGSTNSPTFADLTATGTVTAQEFHTEFVSSSIMYTSGSTRFGNTSDDVHQFSGSLRVTGSGDHHIVGGNVGIGTTSPDTWLHVSGSGGHLLYVSESGAYPRVGIGTTAPAAFLDVWVSANSYTKSYGNSFYQLSDNGGTTVFTVKGTGAADLVNIFDNTTEVFTILDGGNVGIGTTAPPVALTVEGTISGSAITSKGDITLDNSVANGANLILKSSGNTDWSMDNSSGDFRLFRAGDQVGLGITANYSASFYGNVGIGTTAPEGILEIGDISTGPGGMLIKRMTIVEDVATTFWTTPGANEWAGIVEITAVATDDVNRSAYQLSRFAYDDAFTSLISSAQNTSITLSIASTTQMQITMTGAGSTNYRLVIRIMGSEES